MKGNPGISGCSQFPLFRDAYDRWLVSWDWKLQINVLRTSTFLDKSFMQMIFGQLKTLSFD